MRTHRWILALVTTCVVMAASIAAGQAQAPAPAAKAPELSAEAKVDKVFERWNRSDTPGCVVGVAVDGKPVLVKAYGMANLEYGIRLRPDTVFESGSVAKQFTAAAVALLCQDGKLSLDDPVRKYVPEVPDFGAPILIRHLLNHTSGLRSQWSLMGLAGRPTGWAVHTVEEIVELVGRMKELNFRPGEEYLYCNTGYTLLGVVVARVSGKSFDAFCQERLFKPLGMARTQWRDDFREIVPDRATAYGWRPGGFFTNMSFTNVIGNGGLLTTVGDLLIWNGNLDDPRVGGKALVEQMETRGRLNDGFELEYAQGLVVTTYKGLREVGHGGSTAGYQTFLARYPSERLSIAVLSNVTTSGPANLAHQVADIYLAGKIKEPAKPVAAATVPAETLKKYVGVFRDPLTDAAMRVSLGQDGQTLRIAGQAVLALSATAFTTSDGSRQAAFELGPDGAPLRMRETAAGSRPRLWEAAAPFAPPTADLAAFVGTYYSEEIDTTYTLYVENGKLMVRFRPAQRIALLPIYADAFESDGDIIRFYRDAMGRVASFRVYAGRAWRVLFVRKN